MRSYRIVRVVAVLQGQALDRFYQERPERLSLPYDLQVEALTDARVVHFNGFARWMRALGNEAHDLYCDARHLQETWAREHGISFRADHWQPDIVLCQIERLRPDVLFFQDTVAFPRSLRQQLKQRFSFLKKIVIYKCSPSDPPSLSDADILLIGTPQFVEEFARHGLSSELVYHAFDHTMLPVLGYDGDTPPVVQHDFTFVGSAGTGFGWTHQARYWALYELARLTPLEMWIFDHREMRNDPTYSMARRIRQRLRSPTKRVLTRLPTPLLRGIAQHRFVPEKLRRVASEIVAGRLWSDDGPLLPASSIQAAFPAKPLPQLFPQRCHSPLFGLDQLRLLARSRLTFHKHGDQVGNSVGAARLFEATGAGACLVSDTAANMSHLFEENTEVVTYRSIEECVEHVRYLLDHETERKQIAAAGHARTLRDHTVKLRCQQIHELISQRL